MALEMELPVLNVMTKNVPEDAKEVGTAKYYEDDFADFKSFYYKESPDDRIRKISSL